MYNVNEREIKPYYYTRAVKCDSLTDDLLFFNFLILYQAPFFVNLITYT